LLPGMTAYVNVITAQRDNALLVPNTALRFKPKEAVAKGEGKKGKEEKREGARGTLYILQNGQLKPVHVRTGITDNRNTEVISGDLKPDDKVVVEDAQQSADEGSSSRFRMRLF
jgi:HlyD family secretion protein